MNEDVFPIENGIFQPVVLVYWCFLLVQSSLCFCLSNVQGKKLLRSVGSLMVEFANQKKHGKLVFFTEFAIFTTWMSQEVRING